MAGRSGHLASLVERVWVACRTLKYTQPRDPFVHSLGALSPGNSVQVSPIHTAQQADQWNAVQGPGQSMQTPWPWPGRGTWGAQQQRTVFGAPEPHKNWQIHTHDKYRVTTHQPKYNWMLGRFVMDRNGAVWHKQANQGKRLRKSTNALSRMARWKSLEPTVAAKFRKLQDVRHMIKYWQAPEPQSVPGFEGPGPYKAPPRRVDRPDRRPRDGDPALRPH